MAGLRASQMLEATMREESARKAEEKTMGAPTLGNAEIDNWDGTDTAQFISEHCDLPQYALTFKRNLSGATLRKLQEAGVLSKGLSRAGICDVEHQQHIAEQLHRLSFGATSSGVKKMSDNWTRSFSETQLKMSSHSTVKSSMVPATKLPGSISRGSVRARFGFVVKQPEPSSTGKMMQKSLSTPDMQAPLDSRLRRSPLPWGCERDLPRSEVEPDSGHFHRKLEAPKEVAQMIDRIGGNLQDCRGGGSTKPEGFAGFGSLRGQQSL